jgi:hypothetical protein
MWMELDIVRVKYVNKCEILKKCNLVWSITYSLQVMTICLQQIQLIQLQCLVDDTIVYASCQHMTSHTDKMSAGITHAAYMREYRKRKRFEEANCNNVLKRQN